MFNKLSSLFDSNFFVGYFIPGTIFIIASYFINQESTLLGNLSKFIIFPTQASPTITNQLEWLLSTTIFTFLSLLFGIFLLAINGEIFKLMEGYGKLNPFRLFLRIERYKFYKIRKRISQLEQEYRDFNKLRSHVKVEKILQKRAGLMKQLVESFPDEERWLLPTSFGNTIRAFETYSRIMYGIDSIPGWYRLLAVIPESYFNLILQSKAQVDLWVNTWFVSIILIIEYLIAILHSTQVRVVWLPLVFLGLSFLSWSKARAAVAKWGNFIKASFDLFLPELEKKLGITNYGGNREQQRIVWREFSKAFIYVNPKNLPNRENKQDDDDSSSK